MQDPNGGSGTPIPDNYTGVLQPGWLNIQWRKISNLTAAGAPYYSPADAQATGGGFGLMYASTPVDFCHSTIVIGHKAV